MNLAKTVDVSLSFKHVSKPFYINLILYRYLLEIKIKKMSKPSDEEQSRMFKWNLDFTFTFSTTKIIEKTPEK